MCLVLEPEKLEITFNDSWQEEATFSYSNDIFLWSTLHTSNERWEQLWLVAQKVWIINVYLVQGICWKPFDKL